MKSSVWEKIYHDLIQNKRNLPWVEEEYNFDARAILQAWIKRERRRTRCGVRMSHWCEFCQLWHTANSYYHPGKETFDKLFSLIEQCRTILKETVDYSEPPFRCSCGVISTIRTNHAKDCYITLAQSLIPEIEKALEGR